MLRTLSKILLWSLLPNGIIGIIFFILGLAFADGTGEGKLWGIIVGGAITSWSLWWAALVISILMKVVIAYLEGKVLKENSKYAEAHNWRIISEQSWKNFKTQNIILSVSKAPSQRTFSLFIEGNGNTVGTYGFSKAVYAMRFGDYLWERMGQMPTLEVTQTIVEQQRHVWEQQVVI